eukprot:PhM_4_TR8433/c3_g1_i4/m.4083
MNIFLQWCCSATGLRLLWANSSTLLCRFSELCLQHGKWKPLHLLLRAARHAGYNCPFAYWLYCAMCFHKHCGAKPDDVASFKAEAVFAMKNGKENGQHAIGVVMSVAGQYGVGERAAGEIFTEVCRVLASSSTSEPLLSDEDAYPPRCGDTLRNVRRKLCVVDPELFVLLHSQERADVGVVVDIVRDFVQQSQWSHALNIMATSKSINNSPILVSCVGGVAERMFFMSGEQCDQTFTNRLLELTTNLVTNLPTQPSTQQTSSVARLFAVVARLLEHDLESDATVTNLFESILDLFSRCHCVETLQQALCRWETSNYSYSCWLYDIARPRLSKKLAMDMK